MKKRRSILIISAILVLALVCSPVAALGPSGMLSGLASHSRMNSFFSGYSGTSVSPEIPAISVPDSPSGTQISASERIASLLNSDIGNWQPPAGRIYDDLPVHTPTDREEYTALPIPIFVQTCSCCS